MEKDSVITIENKKYIILAGKNRVGRTLYLVGWSDKTGWDICIVPRQYDSLELAEYWVRRVNRELTEKYQLIKRNDLPEFIIEEFNEKVHKVTYDHLK